MIKNESYLISIPWDLSHPGGVNEVVKNLLFQISSTQCYSPVLHCNMYSSNDDHQHQPQITNPLSTLDSGVIPFLKYYFYHYPRMLLLWVFYIKKYNIKVINIHYPVASSIFFCHLKNIFGTKLTLIVSLHGADLSTIVDDNDQKTWQDFFSSADSIVTCSSSLKQQFLSHYPKFSHKTIFIHNGIDSDKMHNELNIGRSLMLENAPYFINVATFEHKKGQDILIRSYAKFKDQVPESSIKLVLIGRETNYLKSLKQLIAELGIAQHVNIFTNVPHADTVATINKALIFTLPSRIEPFGIVLLEAGFCGVPVIANNIGGIPEVITDQKHGLLVDANCIDQWVNIFTNHQQLNLIQYSTEFNKIISQNFTWQQAAQHYIKLSHHK